jgi:cob(I)alamin adenosyltransferase
MIHIYTGDGKGKTTAAMGLAIRAAGRDKKVVIVQFLKGTDTGELYSLSLIPNITVK